LIQWLPKELRRWKSKEKSPLPGLPERALELEAMRFYPGYTWETWFNQPPNVRAQLQAHFLHMRMRESYSMEHAGKEGVKKSDADNLNDILAAMPGNSAIEIMPKRKK
jgi:hypothetical protein